MRAGVVNGVGPVGLAITSLFVAARVIGADARGCREPAVVKAGRLESWLAGLRGELVPRLSVGFCVSRGGLKGFGLVDFAT